MTVVEIVERERARLRTLDAAVALAFVLVVTFTVIGAGALLLAGSRWIALPRVTPLLVWSALVLANGAVLWWAFRRMRRELARSSVAAVIEREQTLRAGALRGVMEIQNRNALAPPPGDRAPVYQLSIAAFDRPVHGATSGCGRRARWRSRWSAGAIARAAPSLSDGCRDPPPVAAWRGTLISSSASRPSPPSCCAARRSHRREALDGPLDLSALMTGEGWREAVSPGRRHAPRRRLSAGTRRCLLGASMAAVRRHDDHSRD